MDKSAPAATAEYDALELGKLSTKSGIVLEWSDISYSVPNPDKNVAEHKTIIHSMSGSARPKELLAVMGTSGAGKWHLISKPV